MAVAGREMRSLIDEDGILTISLEEVVVSEPADDEIVVRVEAAPINPSDQGLLFGPADISTVKEIVPGSNVTLALPANSLPFVKGRLGEALTVGFEGAGTVVLAGSKVKEFEGRRVGMIGGSMYADYRRIRAQEAILLPDYATSKDGAAMFVNPLTALGFVETAMIEGHEAIVHTAAASNLGRMLQKICLADGIPLVNIVRTEAQERILRDIGATYVLNSQNADFVDKLNDAVEQTRATIAFDAIGGGTLGSDIMQSMERAAARNMPGYHRYGSNTLKQLYIYGALDLSSTVLNRLAFGFSWSVSGWLLFPFLERVGPQVANRLRKRVVDELTTTFASSYAHVISLSDALNPETMRAYHRKATGEKFLLDPTLG